MKPNSRKKGIDWTSEEMRPVVEILSSPELIYGSLTIGDVKAGKKGKAAMELFLPISNQSLAQKLKSIRHRITLLQNNPQGYVDGNQHPGNELNPYQPNPPPLMIPPDFPPLPPRPQIPSPKPKPYGAVYKNTQIVPQHEVNGGIMFNIPKEVLDNNKPPEKVPPSLQMTPIKQMVFQNIKNNMPVKKEQPPSPSYDNNDVNERDDEDSDIPLPSYMEMDEETLRNLKFDMEFEQYKYEEECNNNQNNTNNNISPRFSPSKKNMRTKISPEEKKKIKKESFPKQEELEEDFLFHDINYLREAPQLPIQHLGNIFFFLGNEDQRYCIFVIKKNDMKVEVDFSPDMLNVSWNMVLNYNIPQVKLPGDMLESLNNFFNSYQARSIKQQIKLPNKIDCTRMIKKEDHQWIVLVLPFQSSNGSKVKLRFK